APVVATTILRLVGVVGMRWPEGIRNMTVILAALILVLDDDCDRCSGADPFKNATENFRGVFFFSLRGNARLTGFPPGEFRLDKAFIDRQARRASVDDNANSGAVRLAKGCDAKKFAE